MDSGGAAGKEGAALFGREIDTNGVDTGFVRGRVQIRLQRLGDSRD